LGYSKYEEFPHLAACVQSPHQDNTHIITAKILPLFKKIEMPQSPALQLIRFKLYMEFDVGLAED
jgi:hypothetical protein